MNQTSLWDDLGPNSFEPADVQFPDMFKERLAELIPNDAQRFFFMEEGLRVAASRKWQACLVDPTNLNQGWGFLTTPDGYEEVPALVLRFWLQRARDGHPNIVFNNADPREPLDEVEDDS